MRQVNKLTGSELNIIYKVFLTGYLEYQKRRIAECEFELNTSGYMEYWSIGSVELKLNFSGHTEYRNIRRAEFKFYFSDVYTEYQRTGRVEFKLGIQSSEYVSLH